MFHPENLKVPSSTRQRTEESKDVRSVLEDVRNDGSTGLTKPSARGKLRFCGDGGSRALKIPEKDLGVENKWEGELSARRPQMLSGTVLSHKCRKMIRLYLWICDMFVWIYTRCVRAW